MRSCPPTSAHWRGSQGFKQAREVLYPHDLFQQLKVIQAKGLGGGPEGLGDPVC